ncbi:MAG: protoporphyrinogen oxidase HemJ [Nitrospirota bacterium]|nr:protoporphyrinogen oxidase HemJ [Nitrospirota bacterium]
MLWIKALHIIFMVSWFAGLFYLPRLFVYHAAAGPSGPLHEQFCVMERKLYRFIMTPAMLLTTLFGVLLAAGGWSHIAPSGWFRVKLALVAGLIAYHLVCGRMVARFAAGANTRSHRFYRWFNELPTLVLFAVVILAVVRPF